MSAGFLRPSPRALPPRSRTRGGGARRSAAGPGAQRQDLASTGTPSSVSLGSNWVEEGHPMREVHWESHSFLSF